MVVKENISAFLSGILFSFGLCLSQMVDPAVVVGFADVSGKWDPRLLFVMAGALSVTMTTFPIILKNCKQPFCSKEFSLPQKRDLDRDLILGSILFGIGWGLGGVCPGPAVAALAFGAWEAFIFLAALVVGMAIFNISRRNA